MTDRLTPAMRAEIFDMLANAANEASDHDPHPLAALAKAAENMAAEEAARREAEAPQRAPSPAAQMDALKGHPDAPPPTAPFVTDHKWLDPECRASGCHTLILKAEIEKLKDERDKYMWQARDTCRRAEAAEARVREREVADHALVDRYRNPETGAFNFPGDVAAIIRRLDAAEADAKRLREALEVRTWTDAERDGMDKAYNAALSARRGHYESLFAVGAWLLRHRAALAQGGNDG